MRIITTDTLTYFKSKYDKFINGLFDKLYNKMPYKTLEDFGIISTIDNGALLLKAMKECANSGKILVLHGKYPITTSIEYNASKPLRIVGSCGGYPNLTADTITQANENCNLFLSSGTTITINGLGSVIMSNVGISGESKTGNSGIVIKSFHNRFYSCSFTQLGRAISQLNGATHWLGENQYLYNYFSKCTHCFYIESGSDSEFIGNVINSFCDYGYFGTSAGCTISENHFYNKKTNVFKFFNTKIINNYFQYYMDEPAIQLDGSFGAKVSDNQFELTNANDLSSKKHIIDIKLNNACGNISICDNNVNGKNIHRISNLCFIGFTYSTKYDVPMTVHNNNTDACKYLFSESYPPYNIHGLDFKGTITSSTCTMTGEYSVNNGIVNAYVNITSTPTSTTVFQFPSPNMPFVAQAFITWNEGSKEKVQVKVDTNGQFILPGATNIKTCEVFATYMYQQKNDMLKS